MSFELDPAYKQVPERIADLKAKHPEARLRPVDPANFLRIVEVGNKTFIVYAAACYRDADDQLPGIGVAWEPFPGPTPYTKDSELQNAETSAWGRAIVATLASESKSVASAEDVRNRAAEAAVVYAPEADKKHLVERIVEAPAHVREFVKAKYTAEGWSLTERMTPDQLVQISTWFDEISDAAPGPESPPGAASDQPSSGEATSAHGQAATLLPAGDREEDGSVRGSADPSSSELQERVEELAKKKPGPAPRERADVDA